jgi:hypothetical protein
MSFPHPFPDISGGPGPGWLAPSLPAHLSMENPMRFALLMLLLLTTIGLMPFSAQADAPLGPALGLDVAQARQVDALQARHRKEFASGRQDFNRESRALRRARLANDAGEIARLEALTEAMRTELTALRAAHDDEIRALLRADQSVRFDAYIAERRQMRGSSRDEWIF